LENNNIPIFDTVRDSYIVENCVIIISTKEICTGWGSFHHRYLSWSGLLPFCQYC